MWGRHLSADFRNMVTVRELAETARAFSAGTVRRWMFNRTENGLSEAVVKIEGTLWIDIMRFNSWLSQGKNVISDFRDLRTKPQLLKESHISASILDTWLRQRDWNGLTEAIIMKSARRLYIDIRKFNDWVFFNNLNPDFGGGMQLCPVPVESWQQ